MPTTPVKFLTAHGYLSFQKPSTPEGAVTVQYRPGPVPSGQSWEEVYLEGFEALFPVPAPTPPPDTGGGGTTPEGDWLGIPPSQTAEYVAAIKANLQGRGVNLSGPCGAYQIVENVAWGLRHTGCGTFFKDGGNNCTQRSTDVVCYKDLAYGVARIYDILGDSGGLNTPMWGDKEPEDIARWLPAEHPDAINELAGTRAAKAAKAR